MQSLQAAPSCLPSFNHLTHNGVLLYDVDAYIYGTPGAVRNPYGNYTPKNIAPCSMPQAPNLPAAPKAKVQKTDKFLNKVGIAALLTAATITAGAIFKKKFPEHAVSKALQGTGDYIKTLPSKIGKFFKKTPKP